MESTRLSQPAPASLAMRVRLHLYPHRRFLKWLRVMARWQLRAPFHSEIQWRFCRWVSLLTTDPGEKILWRMPRASLKFLLDPLEAIQMNLLYRDSFQPEVMDWVKRSLSADTLFVDAGANVGIHTLIAADYYRAQLGATDQPRVLAFEPNPIIFAQLEENIRLNQLNSFASAFPHAISDQDARANFFLSSAENSSASSLAALGPAHLHTGEFIQVQTVALESVVEKIAGGRKIGLIKLDIEGAELGALRGAYSLIARDRPRIILEVHPTLMHAFGYSFADIFDLLWGCGYEIFRIKKDSNLAPLHNCEWTSLQESGDVICFALDRLAQKNNSHGNS
ncbi:MAG: FkbM family methyltransferase [Chloroflexi bacterium]|nr:FkbM family methyltransferase [Chloroflexota bacterium]